MWLSINSCYSTVVEDSTNNPMIKRLNPTTSTRTEKIAKRLYWRINQIWERESYILVYFFVVKTSLPLEQSTAGAGNTKWGSITVPLTSCLIGLDKSVKQEVNGTVILSPLVFPGSSFIKIPPSLLRYFHCCIPSPPSHLKNKLFSVKNGGVPKEIFFILHQLHSSRCGAPQYSSERHSEEWHTA